MASGFDAGRTFLKCGGARLCSNAAMRLALWLLFVGAFAALNLYGRSEGPRPDDDLVYQYSFAVGSIVIYAVSSRSCSL